MFYETEKNNHGLKHDPFKSCIVPRPIAWITTISDNGIDNCAPYSFFNGVSSDPPMVMFANNGKAPSSIGPKDTFYNIKSNNQFVVNISTYNNRNEINKTCIPFDRSQSEIEYASLKVRDSNMVKPKSLVASPINMECELYKIIDLPVIKDREYNGIIIGKVLGINIEDNYLKDGKVDINKLRPLARLGYKDYSFVDNVFQMTRPNLNV